MEVVLLDQYLAVEHPNVAALVAGDPHCGLDPAQVRQGFDGADHPGLEARWLPDPNRTVWNKRGFQEIAPTDITHAFQKNLGYTPAVFERSDGMQTYRVHCLYGGKIVEIGDSEARNDSETMVLFQLRGENTDCELWCGDRLVATIPVNGLPLDARIL